MGRPKEFNREKAVRQAMVVFWEKGYEATSTEDLLHAMGIGRQSMYDTFGDKHKLYLEALKCYQAEYGAGMVERLGAAASPLSAIRELLLAVANEPADARARGCMQVNAITELAQSDAEVAVLVKESKTSCEALFARVVGEAKRRREIDPSIDERAAGNFILSTIQGMRVSAKAGADPDALHDIAVFALNGLKTL
jgi:TetR/AcrR family transcriptional repressor of nem operon